MLFLSFIINVGELRLQFPILIMEARMDRISIHPDDRERAATALRAGGRVLLSGTAVTRKPV
jgi:hypothetical protein